MKEIVLASNNQHKFKEIDFFLKKHLNINIIKQSQFNIQSPDETGRSFVENAIIKARHTYQITNMPTLADDSGIMVDQLCGKPGIHSARYSSSGSAYDNNIKLLDTLGEDTPWPLRTAHFVCVFVLFQLNNDPAPLIFYGHWSGKIIYKKQFITNHSLKTSFGYDPIFLADNINQVVTNLSIQEKLQYSHRGQCLIKFVRYLETHGHTFYVSN